VPYDWRTEWPGVFARHADSCPVRSGGTCTCGPLGYRASVRDPRTGRRSLSPELRTLPDAQTWAYDQQIALLTAQQAGSTDGQLGSVIDDFLGAAESGLARDAAGIPYTGERLARLRSALGHVDAEIGTMPIEDVRRRHLQSLIDQLYASGLGIGQIGETVDALSSLYVYAVQRELVDFSPVVQLRSPGDGSATPPPVPHQTPMQTHQTPIPTPPQATTVAWQPPNGYEQPTYNGYPTYSGYPTYNGNGNGNGHPSGYMQTLANMTTPVPIQQQQQTPEDPFMRALTPDKILWWSVLLIVIVAILIAIVLAAESV
jgi:hypothetical protein